MEQWGWQMETKCINYAGVRRLKLGFGHIPAGKRPRIKVERLMALAEIPARLVDPVIEAGQGKLRIDGCVESGQILAYTGGDQAAVYDENWNQRAILPVKPVEFILPDGFHPFRIQSSEVRRPPHDGRPLFLFPPPPVPPFPPPSHFFFFFF